MKCDAGLDVSVKEISICIVGQDGNIVARGSAPCDPEGVQGRLETRLLAPERIVHESGPLSIWLQRGLARLERPATCIDAHKGPSARPNKSDSADTQGAARLARTGWLTPVYMRSEEADRLRSLIGARERLIQLRRELILLKNSLLP